jgi:hypothetical protein
MAQSRHRLVHCTCPLSGVKRTLRIGRRMSAFDPKRTSNLGQLRYLTNSQASGGSFRGQALMSTLLSEPGETVI